LFAAQKTILDAKIPLAPFDACYKRVTWEKRIINTYYDALHSDSCHGFGTKRLVVRKPPTCIIIYRDTYTVALNKKSWAILNSVLCNNKCITGCEKRQNAVIERIKVNGGFPNPRLGYDASYIIEKSPKRSGKI
jgi:hypothetical protein